MDVPLLLNCHEWATHTFGSVAAGDIRRQRRLVALAASMLQQPAASLPAQFRSLAALKATYRVLHCPALTHTILSTPHWEQTRAAARATPLVLLVQDTTTIDLTTQERTPALGPIGDGGGRGYLLQSVLAVLPTPDRSPVSLPKNRFSGKRPPKVNAAISGVAASANPKSGSGKRSRLAHPRGHLLGACR